MEEEQRQEERPASLQQLKSGITARAGHKLVLIVEDGQGAARPAAASARPEAASSGEGSVEPEGQKPSLRDARWSKTELAHGDTAGMEVAVEHGEGKRVRFVVEQKARGEWKQIASVEATVAKGKARADVHLQHTEHESGDLFAEADEHEVRFHCQIL